MAARNRKAKKQGKRGKVYNCWDEDEMQRAVLEYNRMMEAGEKPKLRLIARVYKVPKSTLERRVKGKVAGSNYASGRKPYLPDAAEKELADMIRLLCRRGFPFTKSEVQKLAFDYAKAHGISGFSAEKGSAGYYWFRGFLKRHSELNMRKPIDTNATTDQEQPSTSGETSFKDMIKVPHRERGIKRRSRPPSYHLTSEEHFSYIENKKPKKEKPAKKKLKGEQQYPCQSCKINYGDPQDPKRSEEWLSCVGCGSWFHMSCGEDSGILDDAGYVCIECVE